MRLSSVCLTALIFLAACAPADREAEVRAFIAEAVAAIEARRTGFFRAHIDPGYVDSRGQTADQLLDRVRAFFLVNRQVEVFSRVIDVQLNGEDFADVTVQAALIGRREGFDLDAELRSIELELVRDGSDWLVIGVDWAASAD